MAASSDTRMLRDVASMPEGVSEGCSMEKDQVNKFPDFAEDQLYALKDYYKAAANDKYLTGYQRNRARMYVIQISDALSQSEWHGDVA